MKIALSSKGQTIDSEIDERFGRCPFFIIAEITGKKYEILESIRNDAAERSGGAGAFAAKLVAQKGVEAVLTGEVGPHALEILNQFNIKIYKASGKIGDALKKYAIQFEGDKK
jgi:predicted Fe-Mo cluster-binding NifX family protein